MYKQATETVKEAEEEAGWNLEDEAGFDDDQQEEQQQAQPSAKPAAEPKTEEGAMDLEEGGDEIDPLDAFMADNETKVKPIKSEENAAATPQGDCLGWAFWLFDCPYCMQGASVNLMHGLHVGLMLHIRHMWYATGVNLLLVSIGSVTTSTTIRYAKSNHLHQNVKRVMLSRTVAAQWFLTCPLKHHFSLLSWGRKHA